MWCDVVHIGDGRRCLRAAHVPSRPLRFPVVPDLFYRVHPPCLTEREASTQNDGVAKLYELTVVRLWHLAPGFCRYPHDLSVGNNYVTFAKAVAELWKSNKSGVLSSTCNALRLLVDKNLWLAEVSPGPHRDCRG